MLALAMLLREGERARVECSARVVVHGIEVGSSTTSTSRPDFSASEVEIISCNDMRKWVDCCGCRFPSTELAESTEEDRPVSTGG